VQKLVFLSKSYFSRPRDPTGGVNRYNFPYSEAIKGDYFNSINYSNYSNYSNSINSINCINYSNY
jgi:hypothetical protein